MCAPWLFPYWWACSWAAGWATAWQMGAARHANSLRPKHSYRVRTPLLSLHVSMLTPNRRAGTPKRKEMRAYPLKLVPRD